MRVPHHQVAPTGADGLLARLYRAWRAFAAFNAAHIDCTERQLRISPPGDGDWRHWVPGPGGPRLRGSLPPPADPDPELARGRRLPSGSWAR
jgi:hypothetical protein